jgi:hypothetical protein
VGAAVGVRSAERTSGITTAITATAIKALRTHRMASTVPKLQERVPAVTKGLL